MKFFTRELYERAHAEDAATVTVAEDEWEAANDCYERHLSELAPEMSTGVCTMNELLLHDAAVQLIARQDDELVMILRADGPPNELVILRYALAGEPVLEPFARRPGDWSSRTQFNFDELDLMRGAGGTVVVQSIVFANGWLLRLRFRDVQVMRGRALYLPPQPAPALVEAPFIRTSA